MSKCINSRSIFGVAGVNPKNEAITKSKPLDFKPDLSWIEPYIHAVNSGVSVDQLLRKLYQNLNDLIHLQSAQVFLFDKEGFLVQRGGFGVAQEYSQNLRYSIDDLHPITDCARSEALLAIDSTDEFLNRYPNCQSWKPGPSPTLVLPLQSGNIIDGVLYITFSKSIQLKQFVLKNLVQALALIAKLAQITLTRSDSAGTGSDYSAADLIAESDREEVSKLSLTDRQVKIAKMISAGFTNKDIARELEFSEATIRYETIKLYERLRVKNRSHAAARIHKLGLS
jgi:DNA-binding CsgD family transcriptional regulator